jgi:hypothetical protein
MHCKSSKYKKLPFLTACHTKTTNQFTQNQAELIIHWTPQDVLQSKQFGSRVSSTHIGELSILEAIVAVEHECHPCLAFDPAYMYYTQSNAAWCKNLPLQRSKRVTVWVREKILKPGAWN